ncbi:MAG: hypothetical protein DMD42_04105 [Gemmatimonadetes bacterium]|nr:MAG: hypothetical protein DMD42_04105 [Gemmatimonadota bacterium]
MERHSRPRGGKGGGLSEGRGLDGGGDAEREGQGLGAGGARDHDFLLPAHGAHEALELQLERLRLGCVEPYVLHDLLEGGGAEALPARLQAEEVPAPLRQVEGAIPRRLEDAELARALARHTARRDVRDGAVGKLEARVRDIHVRREECDPGRPHLHHGGAD